MDFSNDENLNRMQREAIERAREMHRRANSYISGNEQRQSPSPAAEINEAKKSTPKELFDLGSIKIDEEKALIGMLIYIIYKNGGDFKLLLGLLYLLL